MLPLLHPMPALGSSVVMYHAAAAAADDDDDVAVGDQGVECRAGYLWCTTGRQPTSLCCKCFNI